MLLPRSSRGYRLLFGTVTAACQHDDIDVATLATVATIHMSMSAVGHVYSCLSAWRCRRGNTWCTPERACTVHRCTHRALCCTLYGSLTVLNKQSECFSAIFEDFVFSAVALCVGTSISYAFNHSFFGHVMYNNCLAFNGVKFYLSCALFSSACIVHICTI